ncbi:MAG: hypothetical protein KDA32_03310 [Phycisphaerales bacterium]|nr:hypothetical protein [Phycisphaerales bacterium]
MANRVLGSGKAGIGAVAGQGARFEVDANGRLRSYLVRLSTADALGLVGMLTERSGVASGRILTATRENPGRLRVLAEPPPGYELSAEPDYLRGDICRITGSARSCNVSITRIGADLLALRIQSCLGAADEWIELRARVIRYAEKEGPRCLLEVVPDRRVVAAADDEALGAAGATLAGATWVSEQFADWEESGA